MQRDMVSGFLVISPPLQAQGSGLWLSSFPVREGRQLMQVLSILETLCLSHTHTHKLTHSVATLDAARLWLAVGELSAAQVLKRLVICKQLQFTAMQCLCWCVWSCWFAFLPARLGLTDPLGDSSERHPQHELTRTQ